jgi:hypothetical protein
MSDLLRSEELNQSVPKNLSPFTKLGVFQVRGFLPILLRYKLKESKERPK